MLEKSFGVTFFLKTPKRPTDIRYVYLRITVDGVPKEKSAKRKWDIKRWDQKMERAIGSKEDARALNYHLDSLTTKINHFRTELINNDLTITAEKIMDYVEGKIVSKAKVLEEFKQHNDEMLALVPKEYAKGTHERFVTACSHVSDFIMFKYKRVDLEFRELNFDFVKDYEFYLKTVRECSHNTTLKYISNFKKIVLRAIDKDIIPTDPFKAFKRKKEKIKKKPLTWDELLILENLTFSTERLTIVRDVFLFQCYTGLAYIDVFQLNKANIKKGINGALWIISERQKTDSTTNIPLLPKAIEIMEKYVHHDDCLRTGRVLPVRSNQKMNEYLKEIAALAGFDFILNTHKARRTFASTVTLNNGVPIHVVKEMLGHSSVQQTEEYAITEQEAIGSEMLILTDKLNRRKEPQKNEINVLKALENLEKEFNLFRESHKQVGETSSAEKLAQLTNELNSLKQLMLRA